MAGQGARAAMAGAASGYGQVMSSWDDDDWVGEPPEGRHSRSQADPGFWAQNRPLVYGLFWTGLFVLAVVVVLLALL
jgi:hypothetical protein